MTDALSSHEEIRAEIAAKVSAFEAEYGPIQLLPIYTRDRPAPTFSIAPSDRPKAKPSRALREKDHKRVTVRTTKKLEKIAAIRDLAATGMRICDIAEGAGVTARYVHMIILEHGMSRGTATE